MIHHKRLLSDGFHQRLLSGVFLCVIISSVENYRGSFLSMCLIMVALLEHLISNLIIFLVYVADADNLISTCD